MHAVGRFGEGSHFYPEARAYGLRAMAAGSQVTA